MPAYIISVDSGMNLGYAVWEHKINIDPSERPVRTGEIHFNKPKDWVERALKTVDAFGAVMEDFGGSRIQIYAEYGQYMQGNHEATANGSVLKMIFLTGALAMKVRDLGSTFHLAPVLTWKGQLPKTVTDKRIARRLGQDYVDTLKSDHIRDAVAIGMWVRGVLSIEEGVRTLSAIENTFTNISPREDTEGMVAMPPVPSQLGNQEEGPMGNSLSRKRYTIRKRTQ